MYAQDPTKITRFVFRTQGTPAGWPIVKLVFIGYTAVVLPTLFLALSIFSFAADGPADQWLILPGLFLIIPAQAAFLGFIVNVGLWLFSRFRPLHVEVIGRDVFLRRDD